MTDTQKVTSYVQKHSKWTEQLKELRSIFQETELKEEVKWGSPTYTLNGKLVAGMAAFKNHYAIWFHQGVFLKDIKKKLINAQEGTTRGLRQWRFKEDDSIEHDLVLSYIQESIENSLAGKEIKPQRKKGVEIPPFLQAAFQNNSAFENAFKKLTPGKQREYAEYIASAKQEKTKQTRLEKIIPMVLDGVGLNDKYKNC
ncbi:MAG: YdeI/OmpD-associated family protein [Bacteroidota bacterium]